MDTFEGPQIIEFCLFVNANIVCCNFQFSLQRVAILFESPNYPPRRDDEIALNVESTMYIQVYGIHMHAAQ